MKIAYLITAYSNPKHFNRLIKALDHPNVDFYIHIDKKTQSIFKIPKSSNIHLYKNNIEVFWGSFTFIEAVILLLKQSTKKNYDYHILISGTDYPIKSNEYIMNFFRRNNGKEFINICEMPDNDKTFDRIDFFYYSDFLIKFNPIYLYKIFINKLVKFLGIRRKIPNEYSNLKFYGGSNWWALTDSCVKYILDYVNRNPNFTLFYKNTYIPEEMFFHTIIGNSKFYNKVDNAITYTDWTAKEGPLPAPITYKHLNILKEEIVNSDYGTGKSYILFARKFGDNSEDIINDINKKLRN